MISIATKWESWEQILLENAKKAEKPPYEITFKKLSNFYAPYHLHTRIIYVKAI